MAGDGHDGLGIAPAGFQPPVALADVALRLSRVVAPEAVRAMHIQFIGLIDHAHHRLRLAAMHQQRAMPSRFDPIGNPVPVMTLPARPKWNNLLFRPGYLNSWRF